MAGINISGSNTWEDDITIYTIESFVKGNDISLPDIDNDSNIPLRQLTNRTFRIKSMLDKYGIYIKDEEFKYAGQNLIQSTAIRGDIVNGNLVSFYNNEFWKLDLSQSDEREIFIGIADKTNNRIITNGLIEIINISLRGYNEGDLLYADNENSGEITNIESNTPIGRYLFNDIIYVSLVVSEYQNIRQSKLDNPLCKILGKNKIIDKGYGIFKWNRDSKATFFNTYGELVIAKNDEPRQEENGWLIEGESINLLKIDDIIAGRVIIKNKINDSFDVFPNNENELHNVALTDIDIGENETYTFSCIAKSINGYNIRLRLGSNIGFIGDTVFNFSTEEISSPSIQRGFKKISDDEYRIWITIKTQIGATILNPSIWIYDETLQPSYIGNETSGLNIKYWQCEKSDILTSYIPLNILPTTRAQDLPSINYRNNIDITKDFSIFTTINFKFLYDRSDLGANGRRGIFKIPTQNSKYCFANLSEDSKSIYFTNGDSSTQIDFEGTKVSIAMIYDSITKLSRIIVNNKIGNIDIGTFYGDPIIDGDIGIGTQFDNSLRNLNGNILDFRIYDFILNNSEIKFLSGY